MSDMDQDLDSAEKDEDLDEDLDEDGADEGDEGGEDGVDADASTGNGDGAPRGRRRRRRQESEDYIPADDERAMGALEFVTNVVDQMEMDCRVRLRRPPEDETDPEIQIEISGPDAGRIIGKKGLVLSALQFLTHRVVNRSGTEKRHVLVDAEGYRSRRDNSLATMARRLGRQAVEQGKIITFEPMNPRDRRVVHLALAKFEGVITKSDGEGQSRRVQIIPVRRTTA